jgi:hypothetical protein
MPEELFIGAAGLEAHELQNWVAIRNDLPHDLGKDVRAEDVKITGHCWSCPNAFPKTRRPSDSRGWHWGSALRELP